jgi:hypothetical protein
MMNRSQSGVRVKSRRSTAQTELNLEQVAAALARLYRLLEEYAPSWYTREDHEIADAALHALHTHLNLREVS